VHRRGSASKVTERGKHVALKPSHVNGGEEIVETSDPEGRRGACLN